MHVRTFTDHARMKNVLGFARHGRRDVGRRFRHPTVFVNIRNRYRLYPSFGSVVSGLRHGRSSDTLSFGSCLLLTMEKAQRPDPNEQDHKCCRGGAPAPPRASHVSRPSIVPCPFRILPDLPLPGRPSSTYLLPLPPTSSCSERRVSASLGRDWMDPSKTVSHSSIWELRWPRNRCIRHALAMSVTAKEDEGRRPRHHVVG